MTQKNPFILFQTVKREPSAWFFVLAGLDGYRVILSYSEIFNWNDQSEFLLILNKNDKDGEAFRYFPAADFFADRAVKSVSAVSFHK